MKTSNKSFDFGADPDYDPDAGILKRNFYHYRTGAFSGSATVAELCSVRVFLVLMMVGQMQWLNAGGT